ncbi:zeta toxin family protein [Streptacidiphilus sp. N1-12]|uniref:UDP-N-acetylglucosamine kinase n=1 Tax=Streptacidiphilus alkalitolerans TaxID=3342712 RepID=A0ABV6WRN2_9ACTN
MISAVAAGDAGEEAERIVAEQILPAVLDGAVPQERPVAVWVAGQPGAGKSHLSVLVKSALDRRGGAVLIAGDHYKEHHPHYADLLHSDDLTAGERVRSQIRAWQDQVEEHVRGRRLDAVVETALAHCGQAMAAAAAYRAAGYRLELVVLAVAEPVSQLAAIDRYLRQAAAGKGVGRFVSWANHDGCAAALPTCVLALEEERLVDRVTVVDRASTVLFTNDLVQDIWTGPLGAAAAVRAERWRPWTAAETARFRTQQAAVERLRAHPQVRELPARVAGTGAERAAALAEPVRRTAQVQAGRPGVDYHRLSREEHDRTFEEWIWPPYEALLRPQEHPVVVYVMGQPGAGKTGVATMVKRGLAGRGALRIEADALKTAHPDFADLMDTDPRTAGAKIRADVKGWQRSFEARLRAARSDLVIEIAPGSSRQLLDSARPFAAAGYRVELVTLAVRAPDSLLGTAQRYAMLQRLGLPSRFTTRTGHDVCHAAVADALAAAERESVFTQVMVVDRDGHLLYRSRRDAAGALDRVPSAATVLAAARAHPYSLGQARVFTGEVSRLCAALPAHRDELLAMAALAGPLLPSRHRPALPVPTQGQAKGAALAERAAFPQRLLLGQPPVQVLVAGGQLPQLRDGELVQAHPVGGGPGAQRQ